MNSVTVTMDNKSKNEPRLDEADTFLEQNGGQEEGKKKNNKSEFIVQLRQSKDFRHKIIHTAIVCWSFITLVCMVELNILFFVVVKSDSDPGFRTQDKSWKKTDETTQPYIIISVILGKLLPPVLFISVILGKLLPSVLFISVILGKLLPPFVSVTLLFSKLKGNLEIRDGGKMAVVNHQIDYDAITEFDHIIVSMYY